MKRLALLTMTVVTAACQSQPGPATVARVQRLYDEGLNGAASGAAAVMMRDESPEADVAAWYGGLAEIRRGNEAASRTFFERAALSSNPDVAGGAEAMLGQLAEGRADDDAALRHYGKAWTLLDGSDQRRVAQRAEAIAARRNMSNTQAMWAQRLKPGSTAAPADGAFALQAGAYSTRASATAHARRLTTQTVRAGLGPATVRQRGTGSGSLWLVQCGSYGSRAAASAAKRKLPSVEFVVARQQP
ncbi:MAG: SPOR domain-containing protein [Phycisphaerales bacterium]|jgi:hypothetical protein|nr:SPOR domain-containing protein [Phycisphaerales bacterium]